MVSVCIPTYNGEKYIKEQLDSILSQLGENDEVIISDDSSSDSTLHIIKSFRDDRIKIYPNNHFKSPIFNLENALEKASGDYIFLSDQDDIWLDQKVYKCLDLLKTSDCVLSDAIVVDSNKNTLYESFFKKNKSKPGFLRNIIKNSYIGCCMCFNKKILKMILPFPKNLPMHDIWIGLISEKMGKVVFFEEPMIFYRRHGENASFSSEKSKNPILYRIQYRIFLFCVVMRRVHNWKKER